MNPQQPNQSRRRLIRNGLHGSAVECDAAVTLSDNSSGASAALTDAESPVLIADWESYSFI